MHVVEFVLITCTKLLYFSHILVHALLFLRLLLQRCYSKVVASFVIPMLFYRSLVQFMILFIVGGDGEIIFYGN